jgi:predicted dehydrogenase
MSSDDQTTTREGRAVSRRELLGGAAATVAIPYIIPSGVLAMQGRPGANDRIVTANIGVGGMGQHHVYPDAAALCDVDANHLANAARRVTRGTPFLTKDYRYILDRKDIDAVFIGTPDHWHAMMTVHACQAGKHVYSEKPTARTIAEARAMVNAARRYNRVVQIGAQGRSNPEARLACRYVRNGMLGKVSRVEIWHPNNFTTNDWGPPTTPPAHLDWDLWLGPARWMDYHPVRCHFNFRWFMDFGGGFIRDRGNHALSIVSWLMNADTYKGIVTCEATGTPHLSGCFDVPVTMEARWEFKNPDWTLTWSQPGKPNPRMPGEWGATYYGDRDSLIVIGGDGGCATEAKARQFQVPSGGIEIYLHPTQTGDPTERHRQNFLDCIRTGARPVMDVDIGRQVITYCNLANISYRLGRKVTFDMAKERFIGDEGANQLLSEPYRAPWKL